MKKAANLFIALFLILAITNCVDVEPNDIDLTEEDKYKIILVPGSVTVYINDTTSTFFVFNFVESINFNLNEIVSFKYYSDSILGNSTYYFKKYNELFGTGDNFYVESDYAGTWLNADIKFSSSEKLNDWLNLLEVLYFRDTISYKSINIEVPVGDEGYWADSIEQFEFVKSAHQTEIIEEH